MDQFTKLNLNGVEKYVSAIYDGSGNDIGATYETIQNVSVKEQELSERITSTNNALEALTERVVATEKFSEVIETNTTNITNNANSIQELENTDITFQESLNTLAIQVNENKTGVTDNKASIGTLSNSLLGLNTKISNLEAIVNDETSGINTLNTQVDQNIADIATLNTKATQLETSLSSKVSQETFDLLLARVVALEEALATNHPSEETTE